MDESAVVEVAESDCTVVALNPAEMIPAQQELIAWCDRQLRALEDEADELEVHQRLAIANGWKTSVVVGGLNRCARRRTYYAKIRAALEAGYLLVPNMPIDILAVRVKRTRQPQKTDTWIHSVDQATAELLPPGEGRYVDDHTFTTAIDVPQGEGKPLKRHYTTAGYDEVDFPIEVRKPAVLSAAARAMALRIFDEIGTVRQDGGGRDPILLGRLLDPRGNRRCTSFFIAWWVDTRAL